ncbi:hypothetical protein [Labrys wisconsinensis]|uniref:Uncharacterized protein n=1 Tax=Labrys wisconsinensis TaxID=425677 RepID=A0ABU0JNW3_9HYPH|nr:hypothetical protein [Labrys wisconsinensis]MDQ0475186.1 hypothetical protein [Labrys wisconsinensis]
MQVDRVQLIVLRGGYSWIQTLSLVFDGSQPVVVLDWQEERPGTTVRLDPSKLRRRRDGVYMYTAAISDPRPPW